MEGRGDHATPEPAPGEPVPDDVELVRLRNRQERNASMVEHGRRIGGMPGAMMAGAMIALRDIYEGAKTDEIVAISETPDEPGDVDRDGVSMTVEGIAVTAPALPVTAIVTAVGTRRVRRRARRRQRSRPR